MNIEAGFAIDRVALVIGNSSYQQAPLDNPINDAQDVAAALRELDFETHLLLDSDLTSFDSAVKKFSQRLRQGAGDTAGLFYYSGHGVQVKNENYLLPIDANIRKERDITRGSMKLTDLLSDLGDVRNAFNIVILDACRDNPFPSITRSIKSGLSAVSDSTIPSGMFIAYSTSPGRTAADGAGRNSPYTKHLVRQLKSPERLLLNQVFNNVRKGVLEDTNNRQLPWELSSLTGDFYFRDQASQIESPAAPSQLSDVSSDDKNKLDAPVWIKPDDKISGDTRKGPVYYHFKVPPQKKARFNLTAQQNQENPSSEAMWASVLSTDASGNSFHREGSLPQALYMMDNASTKLTRTVNSSSRSEYFIYRVHSLHGGGPFNLTFELLNDDDTPYVASKADITPVDRRASSFRKVSSKIGRTVEQAVSMRPKQLVTGVASQDSYLKLTLPDNTGARIFLYASAAGVENMTVGSVDAIVMDTDGASVSRLTAPVTEMDIDWVRDIATIEAGAGSGEYTIKIKQTALTLPYEIGYVEIVK